METITPTTPATLNYIDKIFTVIKREKVIYATRGLHDLPMTIFTPLDLEGKPVGDKKKPLVIVLHAGGASYTDNDPETTASEFAARGWIGVSVEYEAPGDRTFTPKQAVLNVFAAIRFLRLKHTLYGVRRRDMFVVGRSAGAITATHVNIAANNLDDPFFKDPINDLYAFYDDGVTLVKNRVSASATFSGCAETEYLEKFLDEKDAPNYDYHGEDDTTVDFRKAQRTDQAFKEKGIKSNLLSFPNTGHKVGHYEEIMADLVPRFVSLFKP